MARTHVEIVAADDDLGHVGTAGWTPRGGRKRRRMTGWPKAVEAETSARERGDRTARSAVTGGGGGGERRCQAGEHRRIDCSDGLGRRK